MRLSRERTRFLYAGIFLVYAVLTLIGALRHELWFDETQAWTIVRDSDLAGIFDTLRYEGHPPLWYMILLPFARLGFSCEVLPLISWFFSLMTVLLILWKAPFGLGMKAAIVFSGGFLFFDSVISRVYCLIPFLLCLIAILYPNRKKHPILFGLLIGLLANTHVCFCGIVGIFGIYMLIELFREWKSVSVRENLFRLLGLAVAGIGVLMLVIPLLNSLSLNESAANIAEKMTFGRGIYLFLTGLDNAMYFCVTGTAAYAMEAFHPIASIATVGLGLFLIVFRRWKKWLIAVLVFLFFYLFVNSVIWWNNPCRAAILLQVFVFFLWIALGEGGEAEYSSPAWIDQVPKRIAFLIRKIGKNPRKTLSVILASVFLTTIPAGVFFLVPDIFGSFSPTKEAADYIRANFDPETVIVCYGDDVPTISAYLPEYSCYLADEGVFCTYRPRIEEKEVTSEQIRHDLAPYESVCEIAFWGYLPDLEQNGLTPIFTAQADIWFPHNIYFCAVFPYSAEDLSMVETQAE